MLLDRRCAAEVLLMSNGEKMKMLQVALALCLACKQTMSKRRKIPISSHALQEMEKPGENKKNLTDSLCWCTCSPAHP